MCASAALEELILDGTAVGSAALLELAPLAPTLEFISAVREPNWDGSRRISDAGLQAALAAFAERGGAPEIKI